MSHPEISQVKIGELVQRGRKPYLSTPDIINPVRHPWDSTDLPVSVA